jgi:ABC-2 type transport system permease protein
MTAETRAYLFLPAWSLFRREIVRFLRQRGRVMGALGTPILFWLVLGSGFGTSMTGQGQSAGSSYLTYFFPGMLVMVVLFTAIFSSISIIQDRNEGFLQGVLAAPVSRLAIVLGKVLGGAALGWGQGMLLLVLAPLVGLPLGPLQAAEACGVMALTAVALSALGFLFAWGMDSVQGFHAVMNLLLFPLWLLSGAFFSESSATTWLKWIMRANPLTYGLAALRSALEGDPSLSTGTQPGPGPATSVIVLIAFTAVALALAVWIAARPQD